MTLSEVQQLVNNKDWKTLKDLGWLDFNNFIMHKEALATKEFVLEFLLTDYGKRLVGLFGHPLGSLVDRSGVHFTESEYKTILTTEGANWDLIYLLNLTPHKTQDFLAFYIDNFDEISDVCYPVAFSITKDILGDGSLNEKFAAVINDEHKFTRVAENARFHFDNAGIKFFDEYASTESKFELLTAEHPVDSKLLNSVISGLPEEVVVNFITKRPRDIGNLLRLMKSLRSIDYTLNDENISTLLQNSTSALLHIMTKDQIIKFRSKFTSFAIADSNKLSLDEFVELYPKAKLVSIPKGFYTEEEIAKYPQLFNPKSSGTLDLYFTKETLKILNREWGTRQRYSADDNGNPSDILIRNVERLTPEIIRYLESKGEIDWNRVFKSLNDNNNKLKSINPNLATVGNFINNYKD